MRIPLSVLSSFSSFTIDWLKNKILKLRTGTSGCTKLKQTTVDLNNAGADPHAVENLHITFDSPKG